ncbi:MAG: hypothetical protein KME07_01225 [Pegethrix bostrychoides GSE-TBD4-15B]|jgi:hypothetical protein|uniref:Uncharacterized protein n=1 Tax=Pegethrix bostrychoides GSE-TBD4-15B TaxID=2839662 RepID=A0A951P6H7_9CYAN|nr:hypothetical protein [Pegethrix bostrychoides GSE-TBD4-15B]
MIQCCRNGDLKADGVTILSSTRQPQTFHLKGTYSLFHHLVKSGTVPQRGGSARLCTLNFKGEVIDAVVAHLLGDSPRQRFIGYNADEKKRSLDKSMVTADTPMYLIGFNADEESRKKDRSFGSTVQQYDYLIGFNDDEAVRAKTERNYREQVFRFPLIEMGHGRQWCEQRVNEFAQTEWLKSFCRNGCPFSECNGKRKQNQAKGVNHGDLREDWLIEPHCDNSHR